MSSEDNVADKPTNTSLVRACHVPLMQAIGGGTKVTLSGVELTLDAGIASATMCKDDDYNAVTVNHTAAFVTKWAGALVMRLLSERKTFTGYNANTKYGGPVLVEALSIVLKGGKHPCWQGMVLSDIKQASRDASRARADAKIAENGGFQVDPSLVPEGTKEHKTGTLKALYKRVFPSIKKAASAFNRAVYGGDWHETDKDTRKSTARGYVVSIKEQAEAVAVTPVASGSASKKDLTAQANALGVNVPKSWNKTQITQAIGVKKAELQALGFSI